MTGERNEWRSSLFVTIPLTVALVGGLALLPGVGWPWLRDAVGLGPERSRPSVSSATQGEHKFLFPGGAGGPARWNPCRPIRYVINPAGAPPGGTELIQEGVAVVSALTGLEFEYGGSSSARPEWEGRILAGGTRQVGSVLISWADADEVPALRGDVAGIGGAAPGGLGDQPTRLIFGGVTLDVDSFAQLASRPEGRAQQRAIVLHELGHLVGLAHVDDPSELMYDGNVGLLDFGPGDREGLAALGKGECS